MDDELLCPLWENKHERITGTTRLFLWHGSYDYEGGRGPVVRLFGNVSGTSESVYVKCLNYYPHFYIAFPEEKYGDSDELIEEMFEQITYTIRTTVDRYWLKRVTGEFFISTETKLISL